MTRIDPLERFLGLWPSPTSFEILGLPREPGAAEEVWEGLHRQMRRVDRHPAADTPAAEEVRRTLREAARELLRRFDPTLRSLTPDLDAGPPSPPPGTAPPSAEGSAETPDARRPTRPAGPVRPTRPATGGGPAAAASSLTTFDRMVLAILVSHGGWNHRSRSKLVAVAAAHGVTVEGLLRVVRGLRDFGRSGRRVGMQEIADSTVAYAPIGARRPGTYERWQGTLAPELTDDSPWAIGKLIALFALVTLIGGVLFVRALRHDEDTGPVEAIVADVDRRPQVPAAGDGTVTPAPSGDRPVRPASFDSAPMFTADRRPPEAEHALGETTAVPGVLEKIGRRIAVAEGPPSDAVYREWGWTIDTAGAAWPLLSLRARRDLASGTVDALLYADTSDVARRLVEALDPEAHLDAPLDVWHGAWRAGVLSTIASRSDLSPSVIDQATRQLTQVLAHPVPTTIAPDFRRGAGEWLDRQVPALVDGIGVHEWNDGAWELWLVAQDALVRDDGQERAVLDAIEAVMATDVDLARDGPHADVLGRLLTLVDFMSSARVRARVQSWFEPGGADSADLWVLTSLLASFDYAPWFSADLVLSHDAGETARGRIVERIGSRWPSIVDPAETDPTAGNVLVLGEGLAERWMAAHERLVQRADPMDEQTALSTLLDAALLTEVATYLVVSDLHQADSGMSALERRLGDNDGTAPPWGDRSTERRAIGRPSGQDGDWAATYESVGRRVDDRLQWLRSLRVRGAGDLGPNDAAVFVREALRGAPSEVRSVAQGLLVELFEHGPNVALELLDQFVDGPSSESAVELVRRLTGRSLPSVRSPGWRTDARRALIDHALSLRSSSQDRIDDDARRLAESRMRQFAALTGSHDLYAEDYRPHWAIEKLVEAWRTRAGTLMAIDPVPDDLDGIDRRRATRIGLAEGPIQRHVAEQIVVLELLGYVAVAEQPALRDAVRGILDDSTVRRRRASSVLDQALEVELAMARVWALRVSTARTVGLFDVENEG